MEEQRNYGNYSGETTVIETFENYEEYNNVHFGYDRDDFLPWFEIFRAGFMAGGNS